MGAVTTTSPVAFRHAASPTAPLARIGRPPPPPQVALSAADRAVIAAAEHGPPRRAPPPRPRTSWPRWPRCPTARSWPWPSLAHQVRLAWCGPEVEIEGILSAKTGGCPEDCHFCSQSSRFDTPVKATPFLDTDEVLAAARETAALGASEFCIVLAVRGPDERTIQRILELVPLIHDETGLNVAVSAGILTEDQARRLADGGVHRYNHNVETARSYFPSIVTTHTWEERAETCRLVKAHGMELCCGALHQHGRDRRPTGRAADPAPGARADRGADQLPQPAARAPPWATGPSSAPGKLSAGSRSSASPFPR